MCNKRILISVRIHEEWWVCKTFIKDKNQCRSNRKEGDM